MAVRVVVAGSRIRKGDTVRGFAEGVGMMALTLHL